MGDSLNLPADLRALYAAFTEADEARDGERAIAAGERILNALAAGDHPRLLAHMHGLLGQLHLEQVPLTAAHISAAIREYKASSAVDDRDRPVEWTWAQKSLGIAYLRVEAPSTKSVRLALEALNAAAARQRQLGELAEWIETSVTMAQVDLRFDGSPASRRRARAVLTEAASAGSKPGCAAAAAEAAALLQLLSA